MTTFDPSFTRDELIQVLSDMGITIPTTSKLPKDALEKRLKQAINASQTLSAIITRPPIDLSQYSRWPAQGGRSLFDAIRRGDLNETILSTQALFHGLADPFPLHKNAFMDVRQTLMGLAKYWDGGQHIAVMQDLNRERCAINIRVRSDVNLRDLQCSGRLRDCSCRSSMFSKSRSLRHS